MQTHDVEQCLISGRSNATASSSIMGSVANSSSSPPSSTLIGDYIGIESCLDLKDHDDMFISASEEKEGDQSFSVRLSRRDERWAAKKEKKEFPPPIPLLARTENLPCHMPWVLKRYYTSDGRLILKEERVRHHGYFRAQRCNGRLTLQLVPLDDRVYHPHCSSSEEDNNENELEHCPNQEEKEDEIEQEKEEGQEENELENCCTEEDKEKEKVENELENILNEGEKGNEKERNEIDKCLNADEKEKEDENEYEKCCKEEEEEGESGKIECKDIQANDYGGDKEDDFEDCANDVHGNGTMKKEILYDQDQRMTSMDNGIGGNVSAFKCFSYNTMTMRAASTCIFEMLVPAMRPIHS